MDVRDKKSISSAVKRVTVCFITAALFASAFFSESMAAAKYSYSAGGGKAWGDYSIAIGDNHPSDAPTASGAQSLAIGIQCVTGDYSIAVRGSPKSCRYATAIGYSAAVAVSYGELLKLFNCKQDNDGDVCPSFDESWRCSNDNNKEMIGKTVKERMALSL